MSRPTPRLVVVDIDGCLTPGEAQPWNFEALRFIADLNRRARHDPTTPAVTLCTGRAAPYVEVLMQAIDAHQPGIYENGGGLYFPTQYRFVENPAIAAGMRQAFAAAKVTLQRDIVEAGLGYFQPGKEVSASLYPLPGTTLRQLYRAVHRVLATHNAAYVAEEAATCINIIPQGIDKGAGVRWLSEVTGIPLAHMGGIGDAISDLKFLSLVGFSAAPANASAEVRARVGYVSPYDDGDGVVDILKHWSAA